jgi:hypothetical protein
MRSRRARTHRPRGDPDQAFAAGVGALVALLVALAAIGVPAHAHHVDADAAAGALVLLLGSCVVGGLALLIVGRPR